LINQLKSLLIPFMASDSSDSYDCLLWFPKIPFWKSINNSITRKQI